MFDWLNSQMQTGHEPLSTDVILRRIAAATILGFLVAGVYLFTRPRNDAGTKGLLATLVLMSILLSMVVMAVGGNTARAFTLAGVLAIVRFRTAIQDTRDGAFVIFAVVIGMAAGVGYLDVALIGIPFVAGAAYVTQQQTLRKVAHSPNSTLKLKFNSALQSQQSIEAILNRSVDNLFLKSSGTCKKGTAYEVTYRMRLKVNHSTFDLIRDLRTLEGMLEVEWKQNGSPTR